MNAAASADGKPRVLVLGYGNPGREDDGLGPAAAAAIERLGLGHVTVCDNYQLVIEDAVDVAEADVVWFVDAARAGPEPYEVRRISPAGDIAFNSHSVRPEVVLALAGEYCGRAPEAYLMGIRGYEFEFREGLTDRAHGNLQQAVALMGSMIANREEARP